MNLILVLGHSCNCSTPSHTFNHSVNPVDFYRVHKWVRNFIPTSFNPFYFWLSPYHRFAVASVWCDYPLKSNRARLSTVVTSLSSSFSVQTHLCVPYRTLRAITPQQSSWVFSSPGKEGIAGLPPSLSFSPFLFIWVTTSAFFLLLSEFEAPESDGLTLLFPVSF